MSSAPPGPPSIALEVEGLTYAYPDGTPALRSVSFAVPRGQRVALVGPNGAGKSTLLLHLDGLLQGSGRVEVLGQSLEPTRLPELRRRVGLVFQDPDDMLFCPTVGEDVAFGPRCLGLPPDEVARRTARALAAVGLAGAEERSPQRLSVGEKRRAALAAALSMEPEVLALDEPTAGLDPRGRRELIELLRGLDCTLLVSTHDLPLVPALCERVLVLAGGALVRDGTPAEVLGDEAFLLAHGLA